MNIRHDWLRRLRDPRGQLVDKGWAGHSLAGSISRVLLIVMVVWQSVMVLAALLSLGLTTIGFIVAASHLVGLGGALVVLRFGRWHLLFILGWWALFVMDWAVSPTPESTLLFAACWMHNFNNTLPTFFLRGKTSWWAPLGATVVIPVAMIITRPDLMANPLVPSVVVTLIAMTVATRIGLSYLVGYTSGVDAEARELEETMASLTTRKSATYQAAEDARVLHDTAINTLGAIANGGAAVSDLDAVRQRCLADIAAIEALHSSKGDDDATRHGFRDAIRPTGIRVRYVGMSDDEIANVEGLLPLRVLRAFSRAVAEAVQNAAKHSGAEEVVVSITRTAEDVRVVVSDHGIGIHKGQSHGTGIKRSILERAREVGIQATIDSALGQGTIVTLAYVFGNAVDSPHVFEVKEGSVETLIRQLRSRAAVALSAAIIGVGIALAALNHPGETTPEWLMVAVVAVASWGAWRERDRARFSAWTTFALIVSGPIAFVLSAWAVGFGQTHPVLWQAIGPTGPLLVLTIVTRSRTAKMLGFAAYLLTALATAVSVAPTSLEAAYVTTTAGFIGLALVLGVTSFVRSLATVATRANKEQQEAFRVGLELAAVEAAAETRRRWRDVGLEQSVSLLHDIGEGRVDPRDPAIQKRCAEEEAFLRQLSLLNPELIQMGTWFARALNAARLKGVGLTVRSGAADATTDDAPQFGRTLLRVIDAMPAGVKLTTALFATARGLAMTLVAPTPHLISVLGSDGQWNNVLELQTLGEQDLAELVMTRSRS